MNITKETEEFPEIVLNNAKMKELDKQIEQGKVSCNIENPEDCESCSGWLRFLLYLWGNLLGKDTSYRWTYLWVAGATHFK